MSATTTTKLGLFKPVPGTSEPFRASDFNGNMDLLDAEAISVDTRLDNVEALNTTQNNRITALETAIDGGTP